MRVHESLRKTPFSRKKTWHNIKTTPQWVKCLWNRRVEDWPIHSSFSHLLVPRCSLRSSAPLYSFVRSQAQELMGKRIMIMNSKSRFHRDKSLFPWAPEWVSERPRERKNERSATRERSEQCGASEWVRGARERASRRVNDPELYASIS